MNDLYVLLLCWYESDWHLIDDTFLGVFTSIEAAKAAVPKDAQVFLPGEEVPDSATTPDENTQDYRYRIMGITLNQFYRSSWLGPITKE